MKIIALISLLFISTSAIALDDNQKLIASSLDSNKEEVCFTQEEANAILDKIEWCDKSCSKSDNGWLWFAGGVVIGGIVGSLIIRR